MVFVISVVSDTVISANPSLNGPLICQRVLSGGLDPWGVGSANLGRPIFASKFPQIPLKQAFSSK